MTNENEKELWFWSESLDDSPWFGPYESPYRAGWEGLAHDPTQERVYVATGYTSDPAQFIDAEDIFEQASDNCPEESPLEKTWAEYWAVGTGPMSELTERLQSTFREWALAVSLPKWHVVDGNPKEFSRSSLPEVVREVVKE